MKKRVFYKTRILCKTCKSAFFVNYSRRNTAKFCSKKCKDEENAKIVFCKNCGLKLKRANWEIRHKNVYCSVLCYETREKEIRVKCDGVGCNKIFKIYPSQKKYYKYHYCSNTCRIKFGPIGELTENKIVDNNYQRFVRQLRHCKQYYEWRNKIWEKYDNKCCNCGETKKLTVHHKFVSIYDFIKKYGFDRDKIYKDEMFFDPNNGELLCRSCHAKCHLRGLS